MRGDRVLIKICGITNAQDVESALEAGVDAVGFNFWPGSPRYISNDKAAAALASMTKDKVIRVGVFVDATPAELEQMFRLDWIDVAQLHGTLPFDLPSHFWYAFAAGSAPDHLASSKAEAFLVDTPAGEQRGGTGRVFDWRLAADIPGRIILAGGLGPDNVAEAIRAVRPWGVDACSRLESAPGRKDPAKMKQFVAAARRETL